MAARIVDALSHPSQRGKLDGKREDDTASRWLVQKRTYFKGNYDRVLTVSPTAIGTQMPNLQGTNLYSLTPDFSVKSVTFEKDCLTVNARPDTKKSAEKWTVHTSHLPELATSLYEAFQANAQLVRQCKDTQIQLIEETFPAYKLKKGKWVDCTLRITNTAIERLDHNLTVQWRARFAEFRSPGVLLLEDFVRTARAFKICAAGDRGHRIYACADREKLAKILSTTAAQCLGVAITVQQSPGSAQEHAAARDGACLEQSTASPQSPLHEFWVSRVKVPPVFWAGGRVTEGSEDGVGRFGSFPRRPRLLSLSESALIEKAADGKRVSRHHDLRSVAALVCFELACESRYYAIEWADGSLPAVFESNRRLKDVALLLAQAQAAAARPVPVLPDFTWLCRKIIGKVAAPRPVIAPAQALDPELEGHLFEQLQNAAVAVHDEVCRHRIIAYEAALAAQPKVVPLTDVPEAPSIGVALPELPPMRPQAMEDFRLEEVVEDTAIAAKAHWERAKIIAGQVAANAHAQAIRLSNQLRVQAAATKDAVEGSSVVKQMGQALRDAVHGAVGEINVPAKHAFLFERIMEFNASVPYVGFSRAFLDQMNRPGRFDKDARRRAYITLEAIFCLLPEAKKEGERRLRPDARTSALLIAVLQALQRLASCPQLQEEVCTLRLFGSLFSLLDCGCDRVAMEAARLLARLWAPEAFLHGSKPFVNKTAGEEYRFNKPEDAIQVKANKAACFDGGQQEQHITALVDGLIASASNHLLCLALVDAVAALVAEPENCNTPESVQMMLKVQLSQQGKALFRLMNNPCARAGEAVMAIVRETLSISADAATPLRSAALDEGIIVKHLLIALQPATAKTLSESANVARSNKVTASREFVQRLVEQHPPTQSLMQRLFPSMLLSLLRKPVSDDDAAAGAPPGGPNWPLFWRVASSENHHLAGLIWDEATRYQLRMALEGESKALAESRRAGKLPLWNHSEFQVAYTPPDKVLKVGDVYVNYLLDNANDPRAVESLQEPRQFFDKLYLHLVFALAGVQPSTLDEAASKEGAEAQYEIEMCLRAMAAVYSTHAHHVGPCKGVPYLLSILDNAESAPLRERMVALVVALVAPEAASAARGGAADKAAAAARANGSELMAAGGVQLLVELAAMAHLQTDVGPVVAGGPALLMDHAQSDVDAVASWWYYEGPLPAPSEHAEPDEPPGAGTPACVGPLSCRALLAKIREGSVPRSAHVWAPGMANPRPVAAVRQLRWMLAKGGAGARWKQLAHACMSAMLALVAQAPVAEDAAESPVVPLPNVIRHLSGPACLPHVVQLLLTQDPALVRDSAAVVLHVAASHSQVMHRLYTTGVFFFAVAYIGRDLLPVAQLLHATHAEQVFQGVQDPALRASLPVGERSILGNLLPESLLYQLEAYGPKAFAEQMTRQVDDPEVLWSQAMREEELLPAVHTHLGALPLRLRDNVLARYDYQPMPPMAYSALKGELWCFRYYLRKLCTPEHERHPLVDPVRFRNEIVAEWRKEMAREAADFSQAEALGLMAIEPATVEGATPEEMMDILKRAYRRQALKLHPDKNPDGPEPFLQMQRAYQALMAMAQGEAEVGGGPRPARISLLLRAQCLLHRREPDVLGEFTYPAYDTLLSLLHSTMAEGLGHEHVRLCLELTWLTLNACPDNAPFLGDKGAVPVLAALLQQCRDAVPEDAPAHTDHVVLATLTLRALALVLRSADARGVVEALPPADRAGFLRNLLWAAALSRATNASAASVATIAAAVESAPLREELLQMAVLATLFTRMLLFNATEAVEDDIDILELRGGGASASEVTAKQKAAQETVAAPAADNVLAMKAAMALQALCGLSGGVLPDAQERPVQRAVRALLTPYLYRRLADREEHAELLTVLTTERSSPLVVWTPAMRKQLRATLTAHRAAQPVTAEALEALAAFLYTEVEHELVVEEVYVRLFVEDPTFSELQSKALPLFLGLKKHLHFAICAEPAALPAALRPSASCAFEDDGPPAPGADPAALPRVREHLDTAFQAAQALITSPTYAAALHASLATPRALAPLICWAMKPCVDHETVAAGGTKRSDAVTDLTRRGAEASLSMLDAGTRVPDVKAELSGLSGTPMTAVLCAATVHTLFCTLHSPCSRSAQRTALRVMASLSDSTEFARVALDDGGYVLLLDVIFSRAPAGMTTEEIAEDTAVRALTVEALAGLLGHQSAHQARLEQEALRLVPAAMLQRLRAAPDGARAVITASVDAVVDTPELVWTEEMHDRTSERLGDLAAAVRVAMVSATPWALAEADHIVHPELEYDLFVGGVYLRRFLDTSKASSGTELSDPRAFLDGVMLELQASTDAELAAAARGAPPAPSAEGVASTQDIILMLGRAAELSLGRYSGLPQHAAQQGYTEWLVARAPQFGGSPELQAIGGCLLRILLQLSLAPVSAQRLAAPAPALVPAMRGCVPWNLAAAIFALDVVRCTLHDANPDRDEVISQAVTHGFVAQLLGLLEPSVEELPSDLVPPGYVARAGVDSDAAAKADSDYVRNLVVEILHKLAKSDSYGEPVGEVLAEHSAVWQKHQRHSGVINTSANGAARATPVANLLRGPTSAAVFALPPPPSQTVMLIMSSAAAQQDAARAHGRAAESAANGAAATAARVNAESAAAAAAAEAATRKNPPVVPPTAAKVPFTNPRSASNSPMHASSSQPASPFGTRDPFAAMQPGPAMAAPAPAPAPAAAPAPADPFDPFADIAAAVAPPALPPRPSSLASVLTAQAARSSNAAADPLSGGASPLALSPMKGAAASASAPPAADPFDPFALPGTSMPAPLVHSKSSLGQHASQAALARDDADFDPLA
eukprot:jgi/Ulvmu1/2197/UM013_0043.1